MTTGFLKRCNLYRLVILLCLIGVFGSSSPLQAQERADTSEWINRTLRMVFLPGAQQSQLYYFSDNRWNSLAIESHSLGQSIPYHGPVYFRLYAVIPTEETPSNPVAEADLSQASKDSLLVMVPKSNRREYSVYAVEDGTDHFPAQSVLFINLTSSELAGAFGDSVATVGAGEHALIPYKSEGSTRLRMRMAVRERKNEDWSLVYSTTTPSRGAHRRWLVIYTGGATPAHIFPDFVSQ